MSNYLHRMSRAWTWVFKLSTASEKIEIIAAAAKRTRRFLWHLWRKFGFWRKHCHCSGSVWRPFPVTAFHVVTDGFLPTGDLCFGFSLKGYLTIGPRVCTWGERLQAFYPLFRFPVCALPPTHTAAHPLCRDGTVLWSFETRSRNIFCTQTFINSVCLWELHKAGQFPEFPAQKGKH